MHHRKTCRVTSSLAHAYGGAHEIVHRPPTPISQVSPLNPQVVATHPVQILGRPDFVADQPSTSLGVLIEGDAVFHKAPSSVYDLRPSLGLQGLLRPGILWLVTLT